MIYRPNLTEAESYQREDYLNQGTDLTPKWPT